MAGCIEPTGPQLADIEDIYISSVLQAGQGKQIVYVYNSVTDPTAHPPGDPAGFISNATVILSCDNWQVQLVQDIDSLSREPVFSTRGHQIIIVPGKTYQLSVLWHEKRFWSETTVPLAPSFENIDTMLVVRNDKIKLAWKSPYLKHLIVVCYPASWAWWSGKACTDKLVKDVKAQFDTFMWDSTGVATAIVYTYNKAYEQYLNIILEDNNNSTTKHFSNISGAYGIFAAMASDTLVFQYKKIRE